MKRLTKFLLLFISLFILSGIVVVSADDYVETGGAGYRVIERKETNELLFDVLHYIDKSETKRSGLTYAQEVNVLEVPASSNAKIVSYGNLSGHKWTLTTVSDLARQFERENPDWKVLAAVNGDFFDINGNGDLPYQTNNPLVTNGEYYKTSGSNAVGFKNDGSTTSLVGGKPTRTQYMVLSVYDENDQIVKEFDIQKVNATPGVNETSVYFGTYTAGKYNPKTVDAQANKFVVSSAELALPNSANDFYGKGVISSLDTDSLKIGQFAILSNNSEVLAALKVGVKIRVQHEFTGDFAGADNITGQNAKFVTDGEYSPHSNTSNNTYARHPRTVVGIKEDGTIVLSVIDGRNAGIGRNGMFGDEMAAFMKSLGVREAYNLDGGGSSVMVVKEDGDFVVKNKPSDNTERRDGNALLVAVQVPHIDINIEKTQNKLDFNVDVINDNGFDISEIYVKMGDITNKVVDGKTDFINLEPNTSYYYELIYRDSKNKINTLFIDGNVKTLKVIPTFKYIKIEEDTTVFKISLEYDDPNNASNLANAKLYVNGSLKSLNNNQLILLKSSFKDLFESFDLVYSYNDNYDTVEVNLENTTYRIVTSIVTETLYEMFRVHNETILKIYS